MGNVLSASGPFLNFALLTALASQSAVGNGEGARVLAQPVTVLMTEGRLRLAGHHMALVDSSQSIRLSVSRRDRFRTAARR